MLFVKDAAEKGVSGMPITVSYPASRTDDSIVYDEIVLTTDENGHVEFIDRKSTRLTPQIGRAHV